jgi:hypothetical protein
VIAKILAHLEQVAAEPCSAKRLLSARAPTVQARLL